MVNSMSSYSGLSQGFWGEAMAVVRLPDPKLKTLGKRGIECIFVGYAEHSKAFSVYVIEPNDSVSINSIIESRDAIFNEHRFSLVPRPSERSLVKGTEDSGYPVVPEKVTEEVVQQPKPELRKSKRHRTPKDFRPEFQLYLIEDTRDEVSDQHSYCFNIEDDPKTFDEAIKSQDVAFWKEAINDEMDSIMGNNTRVLTDLTPGEEVYMNQPQGFIMPDNENKDIGEADVILGIRIKHESNGIAISQSHYIDKVLKKFNYFNCTPVSTPLDTCEKLMPNKGLAVSQLEYSRVISCLMYAITYTRPDIAFVVGKLSRYTSNPGTQHWQAIQRVLKFLKKTMDYRLLYTGYPLVLEGYTDASWISNTEDNSSTSGWVFLLGGGTISWASKKQTGITGSTIESKFVALAAGKEAEWLKNLLLVIPLVCEVSMWKAEQNLAGYLTKGLARDLVIKSAEGMGLKFDQSNMIYMEDEKLLIITQFMGIPKAGYASIVAATNPMFISYFEVVLVLKVAKRGYLDVDFMLNDDVLVHKVAERCCLAAVFVQKFSERCCRKLLKGAVFVQKVSERC
ncbi:zinc finger, CCHC-type containing protein [Tanacetum coccineum]|uniref:Zinc finger, CCHC-type containing protein n=1 Tax=Tanacetum coccineum TaxID=301880 RepID=A0ABQ5AEA2_9ASTR